MSSAAALLKPGCVCCPKVSPGCPCADLDLARTIDWHINVPNCMPADHGGGFPGADPFDWSRRYWYKLPDWLRFSASNRTPRIELGGGSGCFYLVRFSVKYRIDRGSYGNYREWPYGSDWPCYFISFATHYVGPAGSIILAKSTGEGMPLSFIEAETTTDWFYVGGPFFIELWYRSFRYSADCYMQIIDAECLEVTQEVENYSFEDPLGPEWTGVGFGGGTGSIGLETAWYYHGYCSLKVIQTNTVGYYFANQHLTLVSGAHYFVQARIAILEELEPSVRAALFLGGFSNNLELQADLEQKGPYQTVTCVDWSPGADADGELLLIVETTDAIEAHVLFDEIVITRIS